MKSLKTKHCKPCEGGVPALSAKAAKKLLKRVRGWQIDPAAKKIRKDLEMKNFLAAVKLIEKIARGAEANDHHPDLHLTGYRHLRVELSTHAVHGLSENDFILAAKIDALPKVLKKSKRK